MMSICAQLEASFLYITSTCFLIILSPAQEPIQTTRNHTPQKSFLKPVAPHAGNFLPECIAIETEDDLNHESLTSQRHPAAKSQTCHACASLVPQEHSRGMAQSAAVASQYHIASPVDIGGEISTSGLAKQPTTPLNRLETPTQIQCAVGVPRSLQPSAIPPVNKRPSGKGFGVDDLGKPIISGETVCFLLSVGAFTYLFSCLC